MAVHWYRPARGGSFLTNIFPVTILTQFFSQFTFLSVLPQRHARAASRRFAPTPGFNKRTRHFPHNNTDCPPCRLKTQEARGRGYYLLQSCGNCDVNRATVFQWSRPSPAHLCTGRDTCRQSRPAPAATRGYREVRSRMKSHLVIIISPLPVLIITVSMGTFITHDHCKQASVILVLKRRKIQSVKLYLAPFY